MKGEHNKLRKETDNQKAKGEQFEVGEKQTVDQKRMKRCYEKKKSAEDREDNKRICKRDNRENEVEDSEWDESEAEEEQFEDVTRRPEAMTLKATRGIR